MSLFTKSGKKIPPDGQMLVASSVALTSAGLTAMIMLANGVSGQAPIAGGNASGGFLSDIYSVSLTSSDATVQAVTLSDGVNSVTWQVSSAPTLDTPATPYRFRAGNRSS